MLFLRGTVAYKESFMRGLFKSEQKSASAKAAAFHAHSYVVNHVSGRSTLCSSFCRCVVQITLPEQELNHGVVHLKVSEAHPGEDGNPPGFRFTPSELRWLSLSLMAHGVPRRHLHAFFGLLPDPVCG